VGLTLLSCRLVQHVDANLAGNSNGNCRNNDADRKLFFGHFIDVVQVPISCGWAMLRGGIAPPQAVYSSAEISLLLDLIFEPLE